MALRCGRCIYWLWVWPVNPRWRIGSWPGKWFGVCRLVWVCNGFWRIGLASLCVGGFPIRVWHIRERNVGFFLIGVTLLVTMFHPSFIFMLLLILHWLAPNEDELLCVHCTDLIRAWTSFWVSEDQYKLERTLTLLQVLPFFPSSLPF